MNYLKRTINDYQLKYHIVAPLIHQKKRNREGFLAGLLIFVILPMLFVLIFPIFNAIIPSYALLFFGLFLFPITFFVNSFLNKRFRGRKVIGYIQFFPEKFIIVKEGEEEQSFSYAELFRVQYYMNIAEDNFDKHPRALSYDLLFTLKDGTQFLYHTECFIRTAMHEGMRSKLPDILAVLDRAVLLGGVHVNPKVIREFKKFHDTVLSN